MDWVCFATTLTATWVAGYKKWWTWLISLSGTVPWYIFAYTEEKWGLMSLNVALTGIYVRNLVKWYKDHQKWKKSSIT